MATITIKLAPAHLLGEIYFADDKAKYAKAWETMYTTHGPISVTESGQDAAEEAFDLTNNPSRNDERVAVYGTHRSISVGDIVEVDGVAYLCDSFGWVAL